jgi:uncharacterized protein YkwD
MLSGAVGYALWTFLGLVYRVREAALALLLAWLFLLGLIGGCQPPPPAPEPPRGPFLNPAVTDVTLSYINRERGREALAPLESNGRLAAAAAAHAGEMARRGRLDHSGGDGSSPWDRIARVGYAYAAASEVVAAGQADHQTVVRDWMNSPGHRRALLGAFTDCGVGSALSANGVRYWCAMVARPRYE